MCNTRRVRCFPTKLTLRWQNVCGLLSRGPAEGGRDGHEACWANHSWPPHQRSQKRQFQSRRCAAERFEHKCWHAITYESFLLLGSKTAFGEWKKDMFPTLALIWHDWSVRIGDYISIMMNDWMVVLNKSAAQVCLLFKKKAWLQKYQFHNINSLTVCLNFTH